jgi:hypothetical protein
MRILHILDHSIPLHSGYTFRTLAILQQQRALGWETFHLTGPKQGPVAAEEEQVDGWHFYRTPPPGGLLDGIPGLAEIELMGEIAHRIEEIAKRIRPHILHAHSPVLNAFPRCASGGGSDSVGLRGEGILGGCGGGSWHRPGRGLTLSPEPGTGNMGPQTGQRRHHNLRGLRGEIVARGIPAEKVTVIPNAVDIEVFTLGGARIPNCGVPLVSMKPVCSVLSVRFMRTRGSLC